MSAPNASTFDLPSPRRPGTDDFNGIAKIDDAAYPPDPQSQPNAAEWNTMEYLITALGRVCPLLVISVTSSQAYVAHAAPGSNITSGSFAFTLNGTGDVSITWPANTLPPSTMQPIVSLNTGGTPGFVEAVLISNGVRVRTYNAAGTATNLAFTVSLY